MTDDSRRADESPPVDLLVVGGLTIDHLPGPLQAAGGAARYATEAALAAGRQVALHVVADDEPIVREALAALAERATVIHHRAPTTIGFELHAADGDRRLRLVSETEPIEVPDPDRLPAASAVLFAPVYGEISVGAIGRLRAPYRAAGVQGWLRTEGPDGWVAARPLSEIPQGLAAGLRGLDLLIASAEDLGTDDGRSAIGAMRGWAGPGPELVVTSGTAGAWLDDGRGVTSHVAARVVEGVSTVGAGDAFSAFLAIERGAGQALSAAAQAAAAETARYLANRLP